MRRPGLAARLAGLALLGASLAAGADMARPAVVQAPAPAAIGVPDDATLEAAGALIGKIEIRRLDVFDTTQPDEDHALYRLANTAHVDSRESVIRNQLLFETGRPYSRQLLDESERVLRDNRYIYDAQISVTGYDGAYVDVLVLTQDVWTLTASASGSRSGGANSTGISLKEMNLLGTGIGVELARKNNVDRNSTTFRVVDEHMLDGRYSGSLSYSSSSDGHARELAFGLPFYALDSRRAGGITILDDDRIDRIYDLGEIVDGYRHQQFDADLSLGWSAGLQDQWVRRYTAGLAVERHSFTALNDSPGRIDRPQDRTFIYPYLGFEAIQNRFEETTNLNQIARTEDVFMGTRFAGRLGYSPSLGGADPAWLFDASLRHGLGSAAATSLLLGADLDGRMQDGILHGLVSGEATLNWRQSPHHALLVRLSGELGTGLDPDQQVLLGGDSGLRGYPLRFQRGDGRVLMTVEQRLFTEWQPFKLFTVGAAAFVDAGRVFGVDRQDATDLGLLSDVGVGLRLGNRRSSSARMIHIDLAFPLNTGYGADGLQLTVGGEKRF